MIHFAILLALTMPSPFPTVTPNPAAPPLVVHAVCIEDPFPDMGPIACVSPEEYCRINHAGKFNGVVLDAVYRGKKGMIIDCYRGGYWFDKDGGDPIFQPRIP